MTIPAFINNFNVYDSKNSKEQKLIGIGDEVQLPDFETITATISGAGLPGSIDMPVVGQFNSMNIDIPFYNISSNTLDFVEGGTASLTLRGASQNADDSTGAISAEKVVANIKGMITKFAPGKIKKAEGTASSVSLALTYIKITVGSKDVIELNKLTGLFKINGKDAYQSFSSYM